MASGLSPAEKLPNTIPSPDQELRLVTDIAPVFLAHCDAQGRYLFVNRPYANRLGLEPDDVIGRKIPEVLGEEAYESFREYTEIVLKGEPVSFEADVPYKSGTRSVHVFYVPDLDAEGRARGWVAAITDVTDRKLAESALRESEERLRAIVETTPECVKLVAQDGTVLQMNASGLNLLGAKAADTVIGKDVEGLIAPEFRDSFRSFHQSICSGERGSLEFDIIGMQGQRRNMESHAVPLRNPDGTVAQLAITRDVTVRKEAERVNLLLGAIVDSSDDAIVSKDLNGTITSWNSGAQRLFGYTAAETVGHSVTMLIPEDRLDEEPEILRRLKRGERVHHFETVRKRKDGKLLDISLTISPIKDSAGRIIGASKIARDVTDRKRAEREIEELNARLKAEVSALTRMQQISTRLMQADDLSQLLGEILDAGLEITGADMGNIQLLDGDSLKIAAQRGFQAPFLEFFDSVHSHEGACGTALRSAERVIVEDVEKSSIFADTPALAVMLAAGGRAVQSTPLVSRAGQLVGMFSTHYHQPFRPGDRELRLLDVLARQAADLIERKRAESELLASESRFRQLADSMPQMVWTARPDGFIDYYNERWYEFTGFNADLPVESSLESVLHPEDLRNWLKTWYLSVGSGQPLLIQCRFRDRHENRWRWFMGRALPVRQSDGAIVRWFGTCTDIDEQKRTEDELRGANQDLEQFAYSASHDLKEPLRTIKIYSELLIQRYSDRLDGEARQFLDYLKNGASRMDLLVRDLLAYTQVTKVELPAEAIEATGALQSAISNLDAAIKESGATITLDPLPAVRVHEIHLKQLFQNLISNAIKYRDPQRPVKVHVRCRRHDGAWLFAVRDNGIGIAPQYKDTIFGLFKRLHTSDAYSGTGLGLAICQRIVERYQGKIWVESEPGRGSVFLFTIPI
jgi:PAS domain S-box-containing protein